MRPKTFNAQLVAEFGDNFAGLLAHRGITRRQLADKSGVSYDEVVKLVRGERLPTMRTAHRLADALGVTIPDFLMGKAGED